MRIVAATRILDEADIVEAFARHSAAYVSHHVFLDNGSTDGTLDILRKLHEEGLALTVFGTKSLSYNEVTANTFLYRQAADALGADWVVFLDADEFVDDRSVSGGLAAALAGVSPSGSNPSYLHAPLTDYFASASDDATEVNPAVRIRRRAAPSDVNKAIVRGRAFDRSITVGPGSHAVMQGGRVIPPAGSLPGLTYAHFAERSFMQWIGKFVKGWAKVLAGGEETLAARVSHHYRGPFNDLRNHPHLIMRNPAFVGGPWSDNRGQHLDPIEYRGGPLRYTGAIDEEMRTVRALVGYLESLATQHGRILDESPEARALVQAWNGRFDRIF